MSSSNRIWWGKVNRSVVSASRVRERLRSALGNDVLAEVEGVATGTIDKIADAMTKMVHEAGHDVAASGRDSWVNEQVAEQRAIAEEYLTKYQAKLAELNSDPKWRFAREALDRIDRIPPHYTAKLDAVAVIAAAALGMTTYSAPGQVPDDEAPDSDGGEG